MNVPKSKKGFTLIEILIVIGIITILIAAVIIAINPARQFGQARNTQRWTAVNSILNGVHQNMVENQGTFTCDPDGDSTNNPLPSTAKNMADLVSDPLGYDICSCITPDYLASMPIDPQTGSHTDCTTYDTQFEISQSATTGRITVAAPDAELGETISVTR